MMPESYNSIELTFDNDTNLEAITELVKIAQEQFGLTVDGKFGPKTRAAILKSAGQRNPKDITDGWYVSARRMAMHPSWNSGKMKTPPKAIVWHYTATDPGTAVNMAKNRLPARVPTDRPASWHITIETDGSLVQMASFDTICWHAGSKTAKDIPPFGRANGCSIGIELVGHGKNFPVEQVEAAKNLCRALVQNYSIARSYAMVYHGTIDPTRRSDPGPVWDQNHAAEVLEYAYA